MPKYKTLTEKWAAEDAAKAAAKKKATPAPAKKKETVIDKIRGRKNNLDRALKEAGASRKKGKSSRRYT